MRDTMSLWTYLLTLPRIWTKIGALFLGVPTTSGISTGQDARQKDANALRGDWQKVLGDWTKWPNQ